MAIKLLLLTVVLAGVVNGQLDEDDDEFGFGPDKMYYVPALPLPKPPRLPNIPGLPQPPPLPTPPPLLMFGPRPSHFDSFDDFPPRGFPSIEEIASDTPKPDGTFDGVFISSQSTASRTEDGKIKRKGGSTVILNENGKVTVEKMGDSPPEVIIKKEPPFPDFPKKFKHLKPHPFPHFDGFPPHKPFKPFDSFEFNDFEPKPLNFKKFNFDKMKNYVPKEGEHFSGSSSSSHSFSSNVDGVKTSGGSASVMTNSDGDVKEKKLAFEKSDPKP